MEAIITIAIILFVLIILIANVRVVPQTQAYVIERLGTYQKTWEAGLSIKIPFVDKIVKKVSLKELILDTRPQPVITKDNVTMQIDAVVYYQITDPKLYSYGVAKPVFAIENLTATTLRNIVGDLELDETLTSRETVNSKMQVILDKATDPWGIKVLRVELRNIIPPADIQEAMEKQMRAERERREAILRAEGEKRSAILVAEGQKESRILKAEAEKREKILQAEAMKESKIRVAEGQAKAIESVANARSNAYKVLNSEVPKEEIIRLKAMESLVETSKGAANKIIIPTELSSVVSTLTAITDSVKK